MAMFLEPEAARFELRDEAPTIVLDVDVPASAASGEWSALNRFTLLLVDGPGDEGSMLPRFGPNGDITPEGWDEAVERVAGSHVVSGTSEDAPAVFVRSL